LLTERRRIRVRGTVQGVGFRPFVYREAVALGLTGFVLNDSAGVLIEAEGPAAGVEELCRLVATRPPPLARVTAVEAEAVPPGGGAGFAIVESHGGGPPSVAVSVDTAACAACLAEVDDPADRRHRYPFTNCTDCGPRYTITVAVPYDRPATTMAGFTMCAECRREYDDPADRRFHAQPTAGPACGPRLAWRSPDGTALAGGDDALDAAVAALRSGAVVAVKGVGGYHLAVDATDGRAVGELRRRKARDDKPFAVMVADVDGARAVVHLDAAAEAALASPRRPIVLAPARPGAALAGGVAPGLAEVGVFLPYSPLHHLLVRGVGRPIVLTSGNVSDEPIAHEDDDAVARLGPMVDGLLTHDRPIHVRCDDSVARATPAGLQLLRRSRGYAPEPLALPVPALRPVLAVGPELKSTVAVTTGAGVVASHHIGDLEHLATWRSFLQAVDHLCGLYRVVPEVVAHDRHPEYLSTKFALELDLDPVAVQHHHAHVASCLVEHGRTEPVVGVAFDGLGYGDDGTMWGGELLLADLRSCQRLGHLAPVTMPGGAAAVREPWRMAVAWATAAGLAPPYAGERAAAVADLAARGKGPVTTSVGRLFDAVAALLGLRGTVTYEAQAAAELEAMARGVPRAEAASYEMAVGEGDGGLLVLDPAPVVAAVVADAAAGVPVPVVAAGFHEAVGRAAGAAAVALARRTGVDAVVLSGGVFQNARLSAVVEEVVALAGLAVLTHRVVPPNDGGISVGQAAVAAATT
jgi:hydrogenase maturation protein HypF